ncbi:hypothetical protein AYO44_13260 [Planctomycetaceae bacterium SCGC AG-212-F19]|nr:hypothetical protein AYO44_13260 [Planctomycetaceae bacterium SCGC AG-212-F19]
MCRLAGTDVFVHWSWFIAAYFLIQNRVIPYSSLAWDVVEYVAGFGIVLLHEFGHVLACRQVGGAADRVVLWPLGGLAFVAPPPRPGATFWTTLAGPLMNLALLPFLMVVSRLTDVPTGNEVLADVHQLLRALVWFNGFMLVFNLLPIFPLDGGRLLYAVLWKMLGRVAGLAVASVIGAVAGAGLGILALSAQEWWLAVLAGFLVLGGIAGVSHARLLARLRHAERHADRVCPNCGTAPPVGAFWRCLHCQTWFDLFSDAQHCPRGGLHVSEMSCLECGRELSSADWLPLLSSPPTIPVAPWNAPPS